MIYLKTYTCKYFDIALCSILFWYIYHKTIIPMESIDLLFIYPVLHVKEIINVNLFQTDKPYKGTNKVIFN